MQNTDNINKDFDKIDRNDIYVKNVIAFSVNELIQEPCTPLANLALTFNNLTANLSIDKINEYYIYLMTTLAKARWRNQNVVSTKKETLIFYTWSKIVNKDKYLFLHNIRLNALRKLAEQLSGLDDPLMSLRLVEKCYQEYAIFNNPPHIQHPLIAFELSKIINRYHKLCMPLLK